MLNANSVNEMMRSIAQGYNDSYTHLFPMAAIYVYALRKKVYKGDNIAIEGGKIVNSTDIQTHEITALTGTLAGNKLQIEVRNLSDNQVSTIEI